MGLLYRIFLSGTTEEWALENPPLRDGEIGLDKTLKIIKVGDGQTQWSSLGVLELASSNTPPNDGYQPSMNNMIAVTWDPSFGGGSVVLTSGRMYITRISLPDSTITNVHTLSAGAGAVTNAYGAIYSKTGVLLRQSTNGAAGFSVIGLQTTVLTSPLDVVADQYYLGFWYTGATPTMTVGYGGSVLVNAGLTVPNLRGAWTNNGLVATAPDNFGTQQINNSLWFGVS